MRPQDFAFFGSQTEQEISRKPLLISLHLLIQPLHIDAIEKSEIAVQNGSQSTAWRSQGFGPYMTSSRSRVSDDSIVQPRTTRRGSQFCSRAKSSSTHKCGTLPGLPQIRTQRKTPRLAGSSSVFLQRLSRPSLLLLCSPREPPVGCRPARSKE